jgi:F-type H+-transporting ATPase subunit b
MTPSFLGYAALAAPAASEGGFNPFEFATGAAFWTIVIFALALLPMWKFVFGPITRALDERDRKLEEAISAAERTRREAEEQTAQVKADLEKARQEARRTVEEATSRAQRQGEEQLALARAEAEREKQKALQEIEALKSRALEEIRQEVVGLTIDSAGKLLGRDIDDDAHRSMVREFLGRAGGVPG